VFSSTQWATLIGKHLFLISSVFLLAGSHIFSLKSTEYDYVKANNPTKLLRIRTFGRLELSTFKDLISHAGYKTCEKIKESRPTWYNLTTYVFVKFI